MTEPVDGGSRRHQDAAVESDPPTQQLPAQRAEHPDHADDVGWDASPAAMGATTQPVDRDELSTGPEDFPVEGFGTGSGWVKSEPQPAAPATPPSALAAALAGQLAEPARAEPLGTTPGSRAGAGARSAELAAVDALSSRVTAMHATLEQTRVTLTELTALRTFDIERFDRLHAEATQLRAGEHAKSIAPLLGALLRLSDQMTLLASGDDASVAGMLRRQLLQILDLAVGVTAFQPMPGDAFDSSRHAGAGRVRTDNAAADNTVSRTIRSGFQRSDGGIVRIAEVEVFRFSTPPDVPPGASPA